jgi:hypothetical protein
MKEKWFQYVVDNKQHWCNGFTLLRLEKAKKFVLLDKDIMWDLLDRHNGSEQTPEQMKASDIRKFNHCIITFPHPYIIKWCKWHY